MQIALDRSAEVDTTVAVAWEVLRDIERLSRCVPKVQDVQEVERDRLYTAEIVDKLGPFSIRVPVTVRIKSILEEAHIEAEIKGDERSGQARVHGDLDVSLTDTSSGTVVVGASAQLEVLGKLATLGAAAIRRRADQVFDEFMERLRNEVASA